MRFGFLGFPFLGVSFFVFGLAVFAIWIYSIIHALKSKLSTAEKLLWVIIIVALNILGSIIYFVFAKSMHGNMKSSKKFKGKKLRRSKKNKVIAGVCGGIGEYLDVDPTVIRLVWVVFTLFSGAGLGSGSA